MAAVMLFLLGKDRKTEHNTHFCMPLEPVFTRDCGSGVHFTDEPTGALDSHSAQMLLSTMQSINEQLKATILMVTHDAFSASYANRILFLRDGMIFTEILKGGNSRRAFFEKILDVLTMLGGGQNDVC